MLERYFFKPQTLDRIRASWLGESVERYVAWLVEQVPSATSIAAYLCLCNSGTSPKDGAPSASKTYQSMSQPLWRIGSPSGHTIVKMLGGMNLPTKSVAPLSKCCG